MCKKVPFDSEEVAFWDRRWQRHKRIGQARGTEEWKEANDQFEAAKRSEKVIVAVQPGALDFRLLDLLALSDIKRYGGYDRFAAAELEAEQAVQEQTERESANRWHVKLVEDFSILNFLERRRTSALGAGKRDMEELLGVKRAYFDPNADRQVHL